MNSRAKGKRGELEFSKFLRELGYEARRGQQFSGGNESPDVVHSVPGIHFEVKRTEATAIAAWLAQASGDAPAGALPVVAHRKNNGRWVAIMDMKNFLEFLKVE